MRALKSIRIMPMAIMKPMATEFWNRFLVKFKIKQMAIMSATDSRVRMLTYCDAFRSHVSDRR